MVEKNQFLQQVIMTTKYIISIFFLVVSFQAMADNTGIIDTSTKKERNFIKNGNELFRNERYAEAEVSYRKALEQNASSEIAAYNLASSLIKQSGNADPNNGKDPMKEATDILKGLAESAQNPDVVEKSYYNLGNISFNQQQYQQSIDMYKNTLRRNPENDKARQNLRLAQLKLEEQQKQNKNEDKNNNKQDQQNQDKNQNKDNKQQDNKQDKQQNQDKTDNKQDKREDNRNPNENSDKDKQQQSPQQSQGISDSNAEKILKTMENEENATRRKVNERKKAEEAKAARRPKGNQW